MWFSNCVLTGSDGAVYQICWISTRLGFSLEKTNRKLFVQTTSIGKRRGMRVGGAGWSPRTSLVFLFILTLCRILLHSQPIERTLSCLSRSLPPPAVVHTRSDGSRHLCRVLRSVRRPTLSHARRDRADHCRALESLSVSVSHR